MCLCASDSVLRLSEWELQRPGQAHQSGGEWRPILITTLEALKDGEIFSEKLKDAPD